MTSASPAMRERYLADSIATASPAKLLVMLYDRLVLDLTRGEQALLDGDREDARTNLLHAQDIVLELQTSLKPDVWDGAADLAAIYAFVMTELVTANVKGDPVKVRQCRELMEPLRDTWREAALATASTGS
ncbi:flagellar protein FliS [Krasilnikovia cinnamomea]|uniref:Flagellar protein FliS n=1 Tax=Krasilnikovia cinnamomea TaxID=349313 RepID=A0A4Q7ZHY2_9ACTN|nr:flagellar export chaperone FliS [Krasilnikovia cinnamomea]RZU50450.1 flagellar protein FliS [Krasilnikovia cinnamomea]